MQFAIEAMRPDGTTVAEHVEAGDRAAAVESLRQKGLIVLRVDERAGTAPAAEPAAERWYGARVGPRDLILFTRQMTMLLESGTPVVPALEAVAQQTARPVMRQVLHRLRQRVEEGERLSEALQAERRHFDPVFRSMIAAGEATAALPQVFARLCALAQQQQQTRKMIVGALLYPTLLSLLLVGVVAVLLFFVVPRFTQLFAGLRSPLPATTALLFDASHWLMRAWPYLLGAVAVAGVGLGVGLRLPAARARVDEVLLRLPVVGRLLTRLIFARVVRVWAAMLRCHVPLLETIRQSKESTTNRVILRLLDEVEEAVAGGGRVGQATAATGLADPVIVSALRTGEDNGRLAEAIDFVSEWLDEDNRQLVQQVTRLAEPLLLVVMGLVVGFIAMALFVPLFDLATAGG